MTQFVYKVCPESDWMHALVMRAYRGSADDRRDGYIHLSTGEQLAETLAKHFAGQKGLVVVKLDAARLTRLKWEPARNGALFPHLYGDLDPSIAAGVEPLALGGDGRHIIPEGIF